MNTAVIILMSIGILVFIKDSQAADSDEVWNKIATGKDKRNNPGIPRCELLAYIEGTGWNTPREGLTADAAAALVAGEKDFIIKKEWDAMIRTAAWVHSKPHTDVWKEASKDKTSVSTTALAEYMCENGWKTFSEGMHQDDAATYMANGNSFVSKDGWNARIHTAECVLNAK